MYNPDFNQKINEELYSLHYKHTFQQELLSKHPQSTIYSIYSMPKNIKET